MELLTYEEAGKYLKLDEREESSDLVALEAANDRITSVLKKEFAESENVSAALKVGVVLYFLYFKKFFNLQFAADILKAKQEIELLEKEAERYVQINLAPYLMKTL